MTTATTTTEHTITVAAPQDVVYGLIADVSRWPACFPPTVHAERISGGDAEEVIRIWAFANGEVRNWASRRWCDPGASRIRFRQEISSPPVASMGGQWSLTAAPGGGTVVVLTHDFTTVGNDPAQVEWVRTAIDRNSTAELNAVRATTELADRTITFEDSVLVQGNRDVVYDFVYRCQDWPDRLPHVARVDLREDAPGIQLMEMDTRSPDGDPHTTTSVRVCFAPDRIVYKQTVMPPVMSAHVGEWRFSTQADGVLATSRHTVVVDPDAAPAMSLGELKDRVRGALGANSRATLAHAKQHAEST